MKWILIADDEKNVRMLCKEELEEEGYKVDLAGDGKEVISFLERTAHIPDLVIMDIKMPNLDGISALRIIKEKYPDMPVILYSAYNEFKQDFASWASNDYLIKSSDLTELKNSIRHLI